MKHTQYLFFDIDGTLLCDKTKIIPESAQKALNLAREKGHKIFINSGRTYCCFPSNLKSGFDGYLCGCGTNLYVDGKEILYVTIPSDKVFEIIRTAEVCRTYLVLEGRDTAYFMENSMEHPIARQWYEHYKKRGTNAVIYQPGEEIVCSKFCIGVDERSNTEEFLAFLEPDFDVINRGGGLYEVLPKGYSKASAMQRVLDYYGGKQDDSWAFGDSNNDLSMLQFACHAVIMGHHDEGLEKYAEFVADTVEQDGIYKIMKQQGLI